MEKNLRGGVRVMHRFCATPGLNHAQLHVSCLYFHRVWRYRSLTQELWLITNRKGILWNIFCFYIDISLVWPWHRNGPTALSKRECVLCHVFCRRYDVRGEFVSWRETAGAGWSSLPVWRLYWRASTTDRNTLEKCWNVQRLNLLPI